MSTYLLIDRIMLILYYPQMRNSTTHLTLDTYSAEEMVDIECFNCL